MRNPFQTADLGKLPWWNHVTLSDGKNAVFAELTARLDVAFNSAVAVGNLADFCDEFAVVAKAMHKELAQEQLLPKILECSFRRLITIYSYLRQRRKAPQPLLQGDSSVVRWNLDRSLLSDALAQAAAMEREGVTYREFNVNGTRALRRWVANEYWPLVSKFCGIAALPVVNAHIRCMNSDRERDSYKDRFKYHRFGNHHFDQDVYSLPLIVYLSEVSSDHGPFEYLDASYRYSHNFVLRAFHQAVNHDCGITTLEDSSFPILARLPAVFRGGDVIGNLYAAEDFEQAQPVTVVGGVGTAVLFDGFNVIHAGGFPQAGIRKSLFINFRFPVAKLASKFRTLALGRRARLELESVT